VNIFHVCFNSLSYTSGLADPISTSEFLPELRFLPDLPYPGICN
jgi:hypothetical protein